MWPKSAWFGLCAYLKILTKYLGCLTPIRSLNLVKAQNKKHIHKEEQRDWFTNKCPLPIPEHPFEMLKTARLGQILRHDEILVSVILVSPHLPSTNSTVLTKSPFGLSFIQVLGQGHWFKANSLPQSTFRQLLRGGNRVDVSQWSPGSPYSQRQYVPTLMTPLLPKVEPSVQASRISNHYTMSTTLSS